MLYNFFGILSSVFFVGCLFGLVDQLRRIRKRKGSELALSSGYATQSLSANAFFSSFIAFYAFFLYSIMLDEIEPYIFITRLFAALMTLLILFELYVDRHQLSQRLPFLVGVGCMVIAVVAFFFREQVLVVGRTTSVVLALGATVVMVQGGIQQIRKIWLEKTTGALSLPMNAVFMCKDLSNVAFGFVLGLTDGWPLIMLGSVSALLKLAIIAQFFIYPKQKEVVA
ncbi:hypothetical protein [Marinobacterium jannaschii]|uniref:hypothetical protein n=1 Tax=Marinobacterium jannaschii TaxID=64970 RepID=UPI000484B5F3|nr:hypothetical protein [Marinobacterium jannaschii]